MLCYLRLHCELALRAKGVLMLRESGFDEPPLDDELKAQIEELRYLERSLGKSGQLALRPDPHGDRQGSLAAAVAAALSTTRTTQACATRRNPRSMAFFFASSSAQRSKAASSDCSIAVARVPSLRICSPPRLWYSGPLIAAASARCSASSASICNGQLLELARFLVAQLDRCLLAALARMLARLGGGRGRQRGGVQGCDAGRCRSQSL